MGETLAELLKATPGAQAPCLTAAVLHLLHAWYCGVMMSIYFRVKVLFMKKDEPPAARNRSAFDDAPIVAAADARVGSRRHPDGDDVDIPRGRVAATPLLRAGLSAAVRRARRKRRWGAWARLSTPPRRRRGYSEGGESRRRRGAARGDSEDGSRRRRGGKRGEIPRGREAAPRCKGRAPAADAAAARASGSAASGLGCASGLPPPRPPAAPAAPKRKDARRPQVQAAPREQKLQGLPRDATQQRGVGAVLRDLPPVPAAGEPGGIAVARAPGLRLVRLVRRVHVRQGLVRRPARARQRDGALHHARDPHLSGLGDWDPPREHGQEAVLVGIMSLRHFVDT